MPILKLKLGFTSGSDFLPSSSQNRPHHGYPPVLLLLGISKRPQLFPVVKLCLSKLQKPSFPAQPRSWSYFYPVTCVLSPPPLPSPPAPAAHTRRDCRADRAISSPRRERSSAPAAASPRTASPLSSRNPPSRRQLLPQLPRLALGLALRGSLALRGQLARPQTRPRPLWLNTWSWCEGARGVVGALTRPVPPPHRWAP